MIKRPKKFGENFIEILFNKKSEKIKNTTKKLNKNYAQTENMGKLNYEKISHAPIPLTPSDRENGVCMCVCEGKADVYVFYSSREIHRERSPLVSRSLSCIKFFFCQFIGRLVVRAAKV